MPERLRMMDKEGGAQPEPEPRHPFSWQYPQRRSGRTGGLERILLQKAAMDS
jgi:hypothetical protein